MAGVQDEYVPGAYFSGNLMHDFVAIDFRRGRSSKLCCCCSLVETVLPESVESVRPIRARHLAPGQRTL